MILNSSKVLKAKMLFMLYSILGHKNATPILDLDRKLLQMGPDSSHLDDWLTLRDVFEHIFITGSTGSGKTSTAGYYLAESLLNKKALGDQEKIGLVVFLYKSSDLKLWESWCKKQGRSQDVIIIDSEDEGVFNLLEYYKDKEAINAVDALMNLSGLSIGGNSDKDSEHYWEQAKRQRLHRLILLNQLSSEPLNITTLYKLHSTAAQHPEQLQDNDFLQYSHCWQMLNKAANIVGENNPQFKLVEDYFVREMPYMADRTQSSILSLTSAILEPFVSSPMLNRLFCGDTKISLDTLLSGKIVLLNLPIQEFEQSGKLAQVMFKYVLQKRIESRNLEELPNPVVFWIDEYQHYITPYDFLFLSTARSSLAGCVLMTQNISNLYAQIGGSGRTAEERVNSLLSLTNHKFFLTQNSFVTNEFASKTIGMSVRPFNNTNVNWQNFSGSAGQSEQYHYEVMPREFTMLKRGGKHNEGIVEAYVTGTGKRFSNGNNWLLVPFRQPWHR